MPNEEKLEPRRETLDRIIMLTLYSRNIEKTSSLEGIRDNECGREKEQHQQRHRNTQSRPRQWMGQRNPAPCARPARNDLQHMIRVVSHSRTLQACAFHSPACAPRTKERTTDVFPNACHRANLQLFRSIPRRHVCAPQDTHTIC